MVEFKLLAYCGLYCGGCGSYEENSSVGCKGCRIEPNIVNDCPTILCTQKKGLLHCGECSDFPCEEMNGFYTGGITHHALALTNVRKIQEIGIDSWLHEQEAQTPLSCGAKYMIPSWIIGSIAGNDSGEKRAATACVHRVGHFC